MTKKEIIRYWTESAENDLRTMEHLFESGDFAWSLFIGHLVIEKLIKAYYVKQVDINVPLIHDLLRLSEKANLELTEDQKDFLDTVTSFNIKTRYPDYKLAFFKKCTQEFSRHYIGQIKEFVSWIKNKLNN